MIDASVIALAGVIVAGIAAVVSPVAAYRVAQSRNEHERRQAATERRQRRRETAYGDLVTYLLTVRDATARTHPMFQVGDPGPPPESIPGDELRRIEREVALHGSEAVLGRLQALAELNRRFYVEVLMYQDFKEGRAGPRNQSVEAAVTMQATKEELFGAINATLALVNEELREE